MESLTSGRSRPGIMVQFADIHVETAPSRVKDGLGTYRWKSSMEASMILEDH
jgi:hypothetical protein